MSDPLQKERDNLELVRDAYKRSQTYGNAVALQQAQKALEHAYEANRKALVLVEGGPTTPPHTEHQITASVLERIIIEIEKTSDKYDRTLMYVHRLAKQALIEAGRA